MSYGIGRIPADSDDDYEATKAKIEAIEKGIYPSKLSGRTAKCAGCGAIVPRILLMSASRKGSVCPDCYDRYSDFED